MEPVIIQEHFSNPLARKMGLFHVSSTLLGSLKSTFPGLALEKHWCHSKSGISLCDCCSLSTARFAISESDYSHSKFVRREVFKGQLLIE